MPLLGNNKTQFSLCFGYSRKDYWHPIVFGDICQSRNVLGTGTSTLLRHGLSRRRKKSIPQQDLKVLDDSDQAPSTELIHWTVKHSRERRTEEPHEFCGWENFRPFEFRKGQNMFSITCYNKGHFAIYTVSLGYSEEETKGVSKMPTPTW